MIVLDAAQGSREWLEARLGIPTASQFSRIVTPGGKLSTQREGYAAELLAEWALGEPVSDFSNEWTERGQLLEPAARAYYEFQCDIGVKPVGFIYLDENRMIGGSPDGLVGESGLQELKCPGPGKHLYYLAGDECPRTYLPQCQGNLWVSKREWIDFMSYHPGFPPFITRVVPDEKYHAALDQHMETFIDELLEARERLRGLGVVPALELAPDDRPSAAAPRPISQRAPAPDNPPPGTAHWQAPDNWEDTFS